MSHHFHSVETTSPEAFLVTLAELGWRMRAGFSPGEHTMSAWQFDQRYQERGVNLRCVRAFIDRELQREHAEAPA